MKHDLGVVNVNCKVGAGVENSFSQFLIDLHGVERIFLVKPSGVNLESRLPLRVLLLHEVCRRLPQLLNGNHRSFHNGADAGDTEHAAQGFGDLAVVIVRQALHKNSSVGPVNGKVTLARLEGVLDLADQGLLKYMAVFALDADLGVLSETADILSEHFGFNVWYIFSRRG